VAARVDLACVATAVNACTATVFGNIALLALLAAAVAWAVLVYVR
jgi:hypothetical protein